MAPNEAVTNPPSVSSTEEPISCAAPAPAPAVMDIILYWNAVALEANREAHTVENGEQRGPTLSARALGIVHLAMHDAFFAIEVGHAPYMSLPENPPGTPVPSGKNTAAAVSAAACTALSALYPSQRPKFEAAVLGVDIPAADAAVSNAFGRAVARQMIAKLMIKAGEPGVSDLGYEASFAHGRHRQDPDNPDQGFYGPFFGETVSPLAVTKPHELDAPPQPGTAGYDAALAEVIAKGGATALKSTTRTPEETLIGLYWAYDGVKKIGTPPRLYNQIVRRIAQDKGNDPAANARLFALVNVAMADAGKYAWLEKFKHDLWRPVLGVRESDPSMGPTGTPGSTLNGMGDPFWLPLGAPKTNESGAKSFTPNFPAYPSGHATFGAAAFQMVRRFYGEKEGCLSAGDSRKPDTICFDFVSDELNGISVDSNGTVRPRHKRHFKSLWHAIFENGLSRVFLGVHWIFDAFDASDVKNGDNFKDSDDITYDAKVGGVRLGLDIADDIYDTGMKASPL